MSVAAPLAPDRLAPDGPAQVGQELRAARERLGWELPAVAAWLRIRRGYLEALEAGLAGELPAGAYALGYLRCYAAALGLDKEELARRFKVGPGVTGTARSPRLDFPVPAPERGFPAGAAVLVAFVLAIVAYVGWYRLSGEGKLPAEAVQPVPARLAPLAEQAIAPRVPPPPAPRAPVPAALALVAPQQAAQPLSPTDAASVPPSSAAAMTVPQAAPAQPSDPAVPGSTAAVSGPPYSPLAAAAAPGDARLVIRARADTWLLVRERGGAVLLNRLLHPGDAWPVPARPNLVLTTGNAGGTDLVVDGTDAPPLGASGAVRRDLPLDPDLIKDGKLAGPAVPGAAAPARTQ